MRKKNQKRNKVNAAKHAISMVRTVGVSKTKSIALGLMKGLSEQNYTKVHNEKEITNLKNFWANVLGVATKMEKR